MGEEFPAGPSTTCRIVREIRGGNAEAYNALFARFEARLADYIGSRMSVSLRAVTTPEDLLQETYLRAFESFGSYRERDGAAFFDWLAAIARNRLVDEYRRRFDTAKRGDAAAVSLDAPATGGSEPLADLLAAETATGVSTALDRSALVTRVLEELDALPEDQRQAILLCYFQGMKAEDAGIALGGRTANAARLLLARGLRELARHVRGGTA